MSNSCLLNDSRFTLLAFIIRDLNMLVTPLKQSGYTKPITSAVLAVEQLVSKIDQTFSERDSGNKMLWKNYCLCLKNLRRYLLDENENDAYEAYDDVKFTHSCFNKLIDFIVQNKDLLTNRNARMLYNVIIEMTRLYTCYGIEEEDVPIRAFTIAMGLLSDYAGSATNNEGEFKSDVEKMILPYLDKFVEIRNMNGDDLLERISSIVIEIIMAWREQYLKYGEPISRRQTRYMLTGEPNIDFSQEKKDKLADLLTKGIEDQLRRNQ
jgi:hypothetical protein